MTRVLGTVGYENYVEEFVSASQLLSFEETNSDFLPFIPTVPSQILDAGCGAGQNAAALAGLGHSVIAVDPMDQFLDAARLTYASLDVKWANDSLPELSSLNPGADFRFILIDGVWHHLDFDERILALKRIASLLSPGGRCAISLRNGPPGAGIHLFPTSIEETISTAAGTGMSCIYDIENQSSILQGKDDVKWARIVLEKGV